MTWEQELHYSLSSSESASVITEMSLSAIIRALHTLTSTATNSFDSTVGQSCSTVQGSRLDEVLKKYLILSRVLRVDTKFEGRYHELFSPPNSLTS
ncbi:hypothetical protein TNCV_2246591 [Trichonephila clavipes]|nr:hypothetical protein TNCV_2246591 [Trichonephila clavipes]